MDKIKKSNWEKMICFLGFSNPKPTKSSPKEIPKKRMEKGHQEFIIDGYSYTALNKFNADKKHRRFREKQLHDDFARTQQVARASNISMR